MKRGFSTLLVSLPLLAAVVALAADGEKASVAEKPGALPGTTPEPGFMSIFDGKSLQGWHVSAQSGHSGTSKHTSGGRWVVEDGAIRGFDVAAAIRRQNAAARTLHEPMVF